MRQIRALTLFTICLVIVYSYNFCFCQSTGSLAGSRISDRFTVPKNYVRVKSAAATFGAYLQALPLRPSEARVRLFDGREKRADVYEAVVDLQIGKKDLHQCADAVIRLRAEWLFGQKRYDEITFNFTNGFRADYSKWMHGYRVSVIGNKVTWIKSAQPSNTYADFWKYLETVFSYAGTLSLERTLKPKSLDEVAVGDVFIKGGSPGHAVIVVDLAVNSRGEKLMMLAQSYMPAQEIQILKNSGEPLISPWYRVNRSEDINTPEWRFTPDQLRCFE